MKYFISLMLLLTINTNANTKSICGDVDDRVISEDKKIARASSMNKLVGCTVTLIGRSCAISAGHCVGALEKASFNVPETDHLGPKESAAEDIYYRTKDFLRYKDNGEGDDWAVIKIMPNTITGRYPGDVQGHYSVELDTLPVKGDSVRITGYGVDNVDPSVSFSQQTNSGKIKRIGRWFKPSIIEHLVDTMGGNSGSSIINETTEKIIGIHTHGGCNSWGSNQGTLISKNKIFKGVVQQCLDWERTLD
jgi:V8-like Glu-specific endopeptidase